MENRTYLGSEVSPGRKLELDGAFLPVRVLQHPFAGIGRRIGLVRLVRNCHCSNGKQLFVLSKLHGSLLFAADRWPTGLSPTIGQLCEEVLNAAQKPHKEPEILV
jgi:hypothetical protein